MSTIQELFQQAELSEAAYANFIDSKTGVVFVDPAKIKAALRDASNDMSFSDTQATVLLRDWRVVSQFSESGILSNGFSATLFERMDANQLPTGQYTFAIRGSTEFVDFFGADLDLAVSGVAFNQLVSMVNYVLRLKAGESGLTQQLTPTGAMLTSDLVNGIGPGINPAQLTVSGHSLGGYLGQVYQRIFGSAGVYTYNALGLVNPNASIFDQLTSRLGLPSGSYSSGPGENLLVPGEPAQLIGTVQGKPQIQVFSETQSTTLGLVSTIPAHKMGYLTDSLAVYNILATLDPSLNTATSADGLAKITAILNAASNQASHSLESGLDALRAIFLGNSALTTDKTPDNDREKFYTNLLALQNNVAFKGQIGNVTVESLVNKTAAGMANLAKDGDIDARAYAYALKELNPFALLGAPALYAPFNIGGALDPYDPASGKGQLTQEWLTDRATLLAWKNQAFTDDGATPLQSDESQAWRFRDATTNLNLVVQGTQVVSPSPINQVWFGTDDASGDTENGLLGTDRLYGGAGNDALSGSFGDDYLEGDSGDDTLDGEEDNDILVGGAGFDTYKYASDPNPELGGGNDLIIDSDGKGRVTFDGDALTGGKKKPGENVYVSRDGKYTYTWDGGDLIINDGAITVQNFKNRDLGIYLDEEEEEDDAAKGNGNKWLRNFIRDLFKGAETLPSPIILDLNGDGVITTAQQAGAYFDHDGDGFAERTGWVSRDDGLLVWDRNADGRINDGRELFGDRTVLQNGSRAANGFQALAEWDGNADGQIDSNDSVWSNLRIWKDADGNGYSSPNELISLADAGVQAIQTGYASSSDVDVQGNAHRQEGSFTRADGSSGAADDVWFQADRMYTIAENPVEVTGDIAILPDIAGSGTILSLHQAMARDTSGALKGLVEQFAAATEPAQRTALMDQIIFKWTGTDNINPASRGPNVDARKLVALEKFVGEGFLGIWCWGVYDPNPHSHSGPVLMQDYDALRERVYAQLSAQTDLKDLYDSIAYTRDPSSRLLKGDLLPVANKLKDLIGADKVAGKAKLTEFVRTIGEYQPASSVNLPEFRNAFLNQAADVIAVIDNALRGIIPTAGDDNFSGTGGDDTLSGNEGNDTLNGLAGDDSLDGGPGNDSLIGGTGSDTLDGGSGNDLLDGGPGNDIYLFGRGSGQDVLSDSDTTAGNVDTVAVAPGIAPSEVSESRSYFDLYLTINGTTDKVQFQNWFVEDAYKVERVEFGDGTVWDASALMAGLPGPSESADVLVGGAGDDVIGGLDGNDELYGEAGNDTLSGGAGNDVLQGAGGNDSLSGDSGTDYLYGGPGDDTLSGGTEYDYLYGQDGNDNLDGGASYDWLYGGAGDDILYGGSDHDWLYGEDGNDTLDGGAGDDYLEGGTGNDVYLFGRGSGQDCAYDYNPAGGGMDTIRFSAGVQPEDVTVTRDYSNLYLGIAGTNDRLTLGGWFNGNAYQIERVEFSDGTISDVSALLARIPGATQGADSLYGTGSDDVIDGLGGNDYIYGFSGNDTLIGGAGNDVIFGSDGQDVIEGGTGNDTLRGGTGNDVLNGGPGDDYLYDNEGGDDIYWFGRGWGNDSISDAGWYAQGGGFDTIRLAAGVAPDDVTVTRDLSSLYLSINGTTDRLSIGGGAVPQYPSGYPIEQVVFDDGTVWDTAMLISKAAATTEGPDFALGTSGDDSISTLGGNDTIYAGAGNDVLDGGAGNDELHGEEGSDILDGGVGDDQLYGGQGSDLYLFGYGSGKDNVIDAAYSVGNDLNTIRFGADVIPDIVTITRNYSNLYLSISNTSDQITLQNWFDYSFYSSYKADQVEFADGTVWDPATLENMVTAAPATEGNDTLFGGNGDDLINGLGGDDGLVGFAGNDFLEGGAGKDYLDGGDGNDALDGGPDNDRLAGGYGNDIYLFGRGSGQDTVYEYDPVAGNTDTLRLAAGIAPADVTVTQDLYNLYLGINGGADKLSLQNWSYGDAYRIERVEFDDGTVWDAAVLTAKALTASEGADFLIGAEGDDQINGLGGNDQLYGQNGNDLLAGSDGDDQLYGGSGNDTLDGGTGNDWLNGEAGNDILDGGSGYDYLQGGTGDDVYLFGRGSGRDSVYDTDSTPGNIDTVRFAADVNPADVIVSRSYDSLYLGINGNADQIELQGWFDNDRKVERAEFADGTVWDAAALESKVIVQAATEYGDSMYGTAGDDVINGRGGDDSIAGNAGNDTLSGGRNDDYIWGGEGNDILKGGAGDDQLYGDTGEDTLVGGSGNDYLDGGEGNDTYLFSRGSGQDSIYDYDATPGNIDTVQFAADIAPTDITVTRDPDTLYLGVNGGADRIALSSWFDQDTDMIEQVVFADGTAWDATALLSRISVAPGTEGDDFIFGTEGDDVLNGLGGQDQIWGDAGNDFLSGGSGDGDWLDGGAGDDTLIGGSGGDQLYGGIGNDVYLFGYGAGQDYITDYDTTAGNVDTVRFTADVSPADVAVGRDYYALYLTLNGSADQLIIQGWFENDSKIERVEFVDGTLWDAATLMAMVSTPSDGVDLLMGTAGDDLIDGLAGNDTLYGQAGNDTLNGGSGDDIIVGGEGNNYLDGGTGNDSFYSYSGNDIYFFGHESGQDTVYAWNNGSGATATVQIAADVGPGNVTVFRDAYSLYLGIDGSPDRVALNGWFDSNSYKAEQVSFADGTIWDTAVLASLVITPPITEFGDIVYGTQGAEVFSGQAGDDFLYGNGGDDTLDGGTGNDYLDGGTGNDIFLFGRGSGQDTIADYDGTEGNVDIARFAADITPDDVTITSDGSYLYLSIDGSGDRLALSNWFSDKSYQVERVEFADGTAWDAAMIESRRILAVATTSDDYLYGTADDDLIVGLDGNDTIYGYFGDDRIEGGPGVDEIQGASGNDILAAQEGNDVLYDDEGSNFLDGGAGNDYLGAGSGANLLIGGRGDDEISVYGDNTIIAFNAGDGVDVVYGPGSVFLSLGGGIETAEMVLRNENHDLILEMGLTDSIRLVNWYYNDPAERPQVALQLIGDEVRTFDFSGVIERFDALLAQDETETLDRLALNAVLPEFLLGTSSDSAFGGDLAYQYAVSGSTDALPTEAIRRILSDANFGVAPQLISLAPTNNAPVLVNAIADQTATEDVAFSFTVPGNAFADPDAGDALSLSASLADGTALPSWLVFDAATRTFTGMPANEDVGSVSVRVTASDSSGAAASDTFDIGVANANDAPTLSNAIADQLATEDAAFSFAVPASTFSDVDVGDSLAVSVSLASGAVLPAWLTFNPATQMFSGTPANDDVGTISVRVTATDGSGASVSNIFNLAVANTNDAPVAIADSVAADEGAATGNIAGALLANDSDVDSGDTRCITAVDVSDTLGTAAFDQVTQSVIYSADAGIFDALGAGATATDSFSYTIQDAAGAASTASVTVTVTGVNDAPVLVTPIADQNSTENQAFALQVPMSSFSDVDTGDTLAFSATLADGTALPNWLAFDAATRSFAGTPGDSDLGIISVRVTANDSQGASASDVFDIGIAALSGTAGDDNLLGTASIDTIYGLAGNDTIDGAAGADKLIGGTGDDTYIVDDAGDIVTENANEGIDTVQSAVTYALGANLENLTLTGAAAINATGNTLDNLIQGNSAANSLAGGLGNDTYYVSTGDTVVEGAGAGTDTVASDITWTLGGNLENLTLTGAANINGTGNTLNNILTGNSGNNSLNGGTGADSMAGGLGNDTYTVDNAGDTVVENVAEGVDTVRTSISFVLEANIENLTLTGAANINGTGNELNNVLTGNTGANVLTGGLGNDSLSGGAGADALIGGAGDDTYTVDNVGDVIMENPGDGNDLVNSSVSYVLSAEVERLTLTGTAAIDGTGNNLDNILTGNSGVNSLTGGAGNDTLNGGTGADTLIGGSGNDTYTVDNIGDVVTENPDEGVDSVSSSVSYMLSADVENLTLTGTGAINGTGNALDNVLTGNSGANTLTGGTGNDILDGKAGADTLVGGAGDDIYYLDNASDVVTENADEGADIVNSATTRTLAANAEHLILTGTSAISGTGNADPNLIRGNTANNTLTGSAGVDVLEGGGGADTLSDSAGSDNGYLNGGAGNDTLTGGSGRELYIGGTGNDILTTGDEADIIAFNFGDGQDSVNPSSGNDNIVSLGGSGLAYGTLTLQKSSNDLILNVSATDKITFKSWYASSANQNVLDLQVVAEAMAAFNPASSDPLLNQKVQAFDFQGLVGAFDAARVANPGLTAWALTNGLTQYHLSGSDTDALGGDLAYQYGRNGTVAGIGFDKTQDVLTSTQFGTQAQTLRPLASLQDGVTPLS